jgi:lysyl-tRNA synthetase, class II
MTNDDDAAPRAGAEEALVAARVLKADVIRGRGENPFANDLAPRPLVALGDLRARFAKARASDGKYDAAEVTRIAEGGSVHVAGRVVAMRGFGKATFLRVRDRQGEIQLF